MYKNYIKRFLDILLSGIALLVFGIPMLIVSVFVRRDVGNPVLFGQLRIGKDEKEFRMWKFRSMTNERDENGVFLPDEKRLTRLGKFLRKTSIDELPSLINILQGDMSIIGPRPLPTRYLSRYTKEQKRRHEVRPGLSNPATVNGRNEQSWETQFAGDVWYVDHVSFFVDVKCVFDTIRIVLTHKGATAQDGECRGEFIGIAKEEEIKTDAEGNYMKR
jgi:lipopolysaccharide/colanic/teichoic acid biosynthesis glycosyltransferase